MAVASYNIGNWVGDFSLRSAGGKQVKLSDTVGVPVVIVLCGDDPSLAGAAATVCAGLAREYPKFQAMKTAVLAMRRETPADAAPAAEGGGAVGTDLLGGPDDSAPAGGAGVWPSGIDLPFPMLIDTGGEISARFGGQKFQAVLISPNARVVRYYDSFDPNMLPAQLVADVSEIVNLEPARQILQQAPILLTPDVVPPEFCKKLMDVWETQGNQDSGFMVNEGDKTVGKYDYNSKIRRDHFIAKGTDIDNTARTWIGRHIVPEIAKAFNYEVTRLEDMKIACYDASRGGYFRPHRDNTTGATAHRRFAVSILLNDDYEGGYLRFPEYGPHLYRPKAGGAAVFGCSLLHEATDVTAGRRFVLLTFLYGDKEAKMREEYAKKSGGNYRA